MPEILVYDVINHLWYIHEYIYNMHIRMLYTILEYTIENIMYEKKICGINYKQVCHMNYKMHNIS